MNNNIIEIKNINSDCAQYTGTVTVSSYLGDRLIKKEIHHNKGLANLFKFIGNCLQGNFYEAKYNRPCKLVMLKKVNNSEELKNKEAEDYSTPVSKPDNWSSIYAVCNPIMYDGAAIAETGSNNNGPTSSITYHFRVPFLSLVGGSKIEKLMLLPVNASDYAKDACAYFILETPIEVPEASSNFTIIIDWKLTFTNN